MINNFLLKAGMLEDCVSVRERSLQIFGDAEKLSGMEKKGKIFGGKLVLADIGCYLSEHVKIFISYARQNENCAEKLYQDLVSEGYQPWFAKETLLPGQEWKKEIKTGIKSSDIVILLLSRVSVNKRGYFQREMRLAIDMLQEIPEGNIYLIPARLEECRLPDELASHQRVDLFPDWELGMKKLLVSIQCQQNIRYGQSLTNRQYQVTGLLE
ncbi:MAG: toll/interleukin-1 receptor domain-containing protein [Desulfobacteraceae bacterium]|nr:toll/interleukin-1 receptor domain-containing protein [Desulfobacteraceae bacterium]